MLILVSMVRNWYTVNGTGVVYIFNGVLGTARIPKCCIHGIKFFIFLMVLVF